MKLEDYHTLYINLAKDEDRKKTVEEDLTKYKINYTRIEAIYGKRLVEEEYREKISKLLDVNKDLLKPEYWLDRHNFKTMCRYEKSILAKVGCYLSHLYLLKVALEKGYDKILVLEDDAKIIGNTEFEIPPDTDIFYIGGYWFKQKDYINLDQSIIPIDIKSVKICGTYGFILPNKAAIERTYKIFKSVFLDGKGRDKHKDWRTGLIRLRAQAPDFHLINFFQKYGKCSILNPPLIDVRPYESNINDNRKNYDLSTSKDFYKTY